MNRNLLNATKRFATAYHRSKRVEARRSEERTKFFKAIDLVLERKELARKTIKINPADLYIADWVKVRYPGWRMVNATGDRAIIEQDPTLMKHTVVNPRDGMVYGRIISESAPMLDDQRLHDEDYWLWHDVTEYVREIKDPSEWTPDQASRLQQFMVPGKLTVKIATPREATEEELNG
jgi:hypothetical protein